MFWIAFLIFIVFLWHKTSYNLSSIQNLQDPCDSQEMLVAETILQIENKLENSLSALYSLPDRTQAIFFHKTTLLKSFENKDFDQANLSFAKLLESYRQLALRDDEDFLKEQSLIKSLYGSFRDEYNLSIPNEFLPPDERKKRECKSSISTIKKSGRFLDIDQLGFFGEYKESPNGRFTISWSDFDPVTGTGGQRDSGKGTYILLDGDRITVKGKLDRPNSGAVGDNGNFILSDFGFGEGLKGTFIAFSSDGLRILKKKFYAKIFNAAISPDGDYAVCQTANSPNMHGNLLSFFNLSQRTVIWSQENEFFWANSYYFDLEKEILLLQNKDYGEYAYGFDGTFLDRERYLMDREKKAAPYELVSLAKEALEQFLFSPEAKKMEYRNRIFDLTDRLANIDETSFPAEKSYGIRIQGEVFEHENEFQNAIERYEEALRIDARVGVKRRLSALKKKNQ